MTDELKPASPLPWRLEPGESKVPEIESAKGDRVTGLCNGAGDYDVDPADRDYIVAACNAYPALRGEHAATYLAGIERGKDSARAEIEKLRAELAEARKKADEYDAMLACLADYDMYLLVSQSKYNKSGLYIELQRSVPGIDLGGMESLCDVPTFAQARAFLARKEAK